LDVANPGNSIKLDFRDLPHDELSLTLWGSETLLKVALSNILENACKFSDNKKVTLKLLTDAGQILLIITDEGVGIPSDELKNIFEPFYRGSNVRDMEGFGFGLPLAYRIIKLHSGEIRVSSQVGKGTIVKIKLPAQEKYQS
jgi:signal transduction histidine kinase